MPDIDTTTIVKLCQYLLTTLDRDITVNGETIAAGTQVLLLPQTTAHSVRVPGSQSLLEAWNTLSKTDHTHPTYAAIGTNLVAHIADALAHGSGKQDKSPSDGKLYGLKDGSLEEILSGSGGGGNILTYTYAARGGLRNINDAAQGDVALVQDLGLFSFVVGSDEPDDDETAFAAAGGVWLLQAVSLDKSVSYIRSLLDENSWFRVHTVASTVTSVAASSSATVVSDEQVGVESGDFMLAVRPAGADAKLVFSAYSDYWRRIKLVINNTATSAATVPAGNISVLVFYVGAANA
jgi:hypothetical protein